MIGKQAVLIIVFLVLFLCLRLFNLTGIPIFNDEAIYLDWSWRQFFTANNLFYSLYDAKPPLLLWIFGIANLFSPSLLLAGRIVSVCFALITVLGIFLTGQYLYSKKVALLASVAYTVIPIFSFFDRQALMESAIGAIGVWLSYGLLKYLHSTKFRYAIFCVTIFGLGYFIKPNALLFLFPLYFLLLLQTIRKKLSFKKLLFFSLIFFITAGVILLPLFLQPLFWENFHLNQRYTVVPTIEGLLSRTISLVSIVAILIGPFFTISLMLGFYSLFRSKRHKEFSLFVWISIPVLITLLISRNLIERYIVSCLPLITIVIANIFSGLNRKKRTVTFVAFSLTFLLTVIRVISPITYFKLTQQVNPQSLIEYTQGFSSGYGIPEVIDFIEKQRANKPAFIATGFNTGSPESGVMVHFMKQANVLVSYLESGYLKDVDSYDCLSSTVPIFYITRETDTKGLDRFLEQLYFEKNPISNFGIGVYTLKKNCTGKTLQLQGFRT